MKTLVDSLSYEMIKYGAVYAFLFLGLSLVAVFIFADILKNQRFRVALVLANTIVLSIITAIRCQTDDALADLIWHAQLSLDFALGPLLPMISWLYAGVHSRIVLPFLIFLFLGGLQYYLIGRAIDFVVEKVAARFKKEAR